MVVPGCEQQKLKHVQSQIAEAQIIGKPACAFYKLTSVTKVWRVAEGTRVTHQYVALKWTLRKPSGPNSTSKNFEALIALNLIQQPETESPSAQAH